jgi:hypothetical protein
MRTALTALLLGAVLLVSGCSAEDDVATSERTDVASESTAASSEPAPESESESVEPQPEVEPASADLQRVATAFVRFARDESPVPPADTPVTLLLGGWQTKVLPGDVQTTLRAWGSCPAGGYYAGRTCPLNPVRTIAEHVGPLAFLAQRPKHSCAHPRPVTPEGVGATRSVTITPDELLDCTSFWAVELFVNDVGQIVAVNTVWAEP